MFWMIRFYLTRRNLPNRHKLPIFYFYMLWLVELQEANYWLAIRRQSQISSFRVIFMSKKLVGRSVGGKIFRDFWKLVAEGGKLWNGILWASSVASRKRFSFFITVFKKKWKYKYKKSAFSLWLLNFELWPQKWRILKMAD